MKLTMDIQRLIFEVFLLLDDGDRRALGTLNLSVAQFNTLRHLDHERGLTINELSELLWCDKSNTTRLVDRLVEEGLATREPDPNDRRFVQVRLTMAGHHLRYRALALYEASIAQRLAALPEDDLMALEQLLSRVRDTLQRQLVETC